MINLILLFSVQYIFPIKSIVGQFLYLEGHEYLMYNTYDVHFYSGTLRYTALHCLALCYTMLHCTSQHCLQSTTLSCTMLHHTALRCTTLSRTTLHCTSQHRTKLYYTTLHCTTTVYYTALHHTVLHNATQLAIRVPILIWDFMTSHHITSHHRICSLTTMAPSRILSATRLCKVM